MPQIKPYISQTNPAGPNPYIQRATGQEFGSGVGQAVEQMGGQVTQAGDAVAYAAEQQQKSDINAKLANAHADLTAQYKEDLQSGTLNTDDFKQKVNDRLDEIQDGITMPGARRMFNDMANQMQSHFLETAMNGQAELASDKAVSDFQASLEGRSSALENDPSGFEMASQQNSDYIDSLVADKRLQATKAPELKRKSETELAKSAIYGVARLDPDQALHELDSGKWDQYVNGDQKRRMYLEVRQTANAKLIDQERADRARQEQLAKEQEQTQNDFLARMQNGKLTTNDVLDSNLDPFGAGSKQTFLEMLDKKNKETKENKIKTDPYIMTELFDRIHADGNNANGPKPITDVNELNQYFGHGLDGQSLMFLRKEIQNKGTVEGDAEETIKKNFFNMAYQRLAKPDPFTKIADPKGMELYNSFQIQALKQYQDGLTRGLKPQDMFDPKSDNYLGKNIDQFQRPLDAILSDVTNRGAAPQGSPSPSPLPSGSPSPSPAGTPAANADEQVSVLSPKGVRGKIPKSKLQQAIANGYKEVK